MLKKIDKKLCLLVVAVILLAGGLIWLAFFWQLAKIREISDSIQKEQLNSLVKQQRSQKILELGKELGDVEEYQKKMDAMLVDGENAVPFLRELEAVAAATGNSIEISVTDLSKIKPQAAKKPASQESDTESTEGIKKESQASKTAKPQGAKQDFSNQLGFSVTLTGESRSLVDFLTKLENMPYFVKVYSFQTAPFSKNQASRPVGSEAVQTLEQAAQAAPSEAGDKNIKTTLIIGVYTNGAK